MPNRTKRTPTRVSKFLATLRSRANVSEAAAAIGVGRTAVYSWRASDPAFAEAWDNAIDDAVDALHAEAWRRAVDGIDRPITWQGQVVGTVTEYSDRLLECLLRAHRPEKFRAAFKRQSAADSSSFNAFLIEACARARASRKVE